jgi:hypothetical protein
MQSVHDSGCSYAPIGVPRKLLHNIGFSKLPSASLYLHKNIGCWYIKLFKMIFFKI